MKVPLVDLRPQHDEVRVEIERAIAGAIDDSAFVGGPAVDGFEAAFARYCGLPHAVSVASGTQALEFALRAAGVSPGDLVLTQPNTFIATVEAIRQLGAEPRFIDIDRATFNMDTELLAEYLKQRASLDARGTLRERSSGRPITALLPVHLYGLPADMPGLMKLANGFNLRVVEDACQAHGARSKSEDGQVRFAGTWGIAGCFSFYPTKNLGAIGEAGAVVTDDDQLAGEIRLFRNHGERERYISVSSHGVNGRMDAIQAAVLQIKLPHLETWNCLRRRAAGWYAQALAGSGIAVPAEPICREHVYHLFVVRVPDRDRVRSALAERGVGTGLHYPVPIHLQPGFRFLGLQPGAFPESEAAADEILTLPMFPHISREQVEYAAQSLLAVL